MLEEWLVKDVLCMDFCKQELITLPVLVNAIWLLYVLFVLFAVMGRCML